MKRKYVFLLLPLAVSLLFAQPSCDKLGKVLEEVGLSNEEVIRGLRVALDTAARDASREASKVDGFLKNGLIRIGLPQELQPLVDVGKKKTGYALLDYLIGSGFQSLLDPFEESMNRAAEFASKEALPIFSKAIREMSLTDGLAILQGGETAATEYMRSKTNEELRALFRPMVSRAMKEARVMEYWTPVAEKYNQIMQIPRISSVFKEQGVNFPESIPTDFADYVTEKGLEGLYILMAGEEKKIRANPLAYASEIINRVFSSAEARVRR